MVKTTIVLPEGLYEKIRNYAHENKVSIGSVLREASVMYLDLNKDEELAGVKQAVAVKVSTKNLGDCQVHFMDSTPGAEFCDGIAEYEWEIPSNWQQIEGVTKINLCKKHYNAMTMEVEK